MNWVKFNVIDLSFNERQYGIKLVNPHDAR